MLASVLVGAAPGLAGERAHVVQPGESASSLAKKYYGDPDLGDLLLRYHGKSGTLIHPGERLTIPYCDVHRARPGDTWSVLAKRHLGRASAYSALAELNGFAPEKPLRVGERIVLPVVLRHTLVRGETLASLAELFYGDDRKSRTLQVFNRIEDTRRLAVGTKLEVPLIGFRRREEGQVEKDARERPTAAKKETPPIVAQQPAVPEGPTKKPPSPAAPERRFEDRIAEAERSFSDGDYDRAREILEALREPVASRGTASDRRELGRVLAFVYVAFDLGEEACEAYRSASVPAGDKELDPDLISPRIREALSKCPVRPTGPPVP